MNLLFTSGDCNGIGIECFIKAVRSATSFLLEQCIKCTLCIHQDTLTEYCRQLSLSYSFTNNILLIDEFPVHVISCKTYSPVAFGVESIYSGRLAKESLETCIEVLLQKTYDAVVTLPVSKGALYLAGWNYPGQTEMITAACNQDNPLMILCSKTVRVALATIHIPISEVSKQLNQKAITAKIQQFHLSLQNDFGIINPRIAVLGLNPHAGEHGSIGTEEQTIVLPAIAKANENGLSAYGPFPADGFFAFGDYKNFDGILAMYHDQGLIPLKLLAKGGGVNVTGGLPIVRTSPDHGTGFGIAGRGIADETSTVEAITTAFSIYSQHRTRN